MKQILFLLLFPCLALAQYQGNANQKITLGEQTTADGLVWRGRLADTANLLTNKLDTSVYIVLDTGTRAMWYYRASTTPKWTRLVDSLNNLQGTLSVAKGGTGSATQNFVDLSTNQSIEGTKTFISAVTGARFNPTSSTATGDGMFLPTTNTLAFSTAGLNRLQIGPNGRVGIGTTTLTAILNIKEVGSELSIGTNANNVFFEAINRENTALSVDYGFYARNGKHRFWTGQYTERMTILNNGNVGIGTDSPAVQFHTTGGVRFAGLASITDLRTDANGDLFNGSDFNLKNSIDTINFGLSDVLKLKPVSFNWNDEQRNINEYKSMGFIAQDVMDVIPNAASTMGDGDMQVDYNAIVATLTKAIQEQQALIKALEQRIINLENK